MSPSKANIIIPFGDASAYLNALTNWEQIDDLIASVKELQKVNLTVIQSTPGNFIKALQSEKEQVNYPVFNWDYVQFSKDTGFMWSGLYSNAPDFKKQIKDYSGLFHAQSRLFAKRVIN
jgi:hypothetical protein